MSTLSSQKVFTKDQTVTRGGLVYHQDTNELVTGIVEEVRDNGQLRIRNNFKDGKRDGPWEWFHKNNQLWVKGNYKNGEEDGLWEWFDEDGNLTETRTYRNGEVVETNEDP